MRNLLAFISRYQFFFFFLIFLVISFILIYNNNYYQRSKIVSTTGNITGKMNRVYTNFASFFELKKSNTQLLEENAQLRSLLSKRTNTISDSLTWLESGLSIHYVSAKVISNTVQFRNNYFMLDKGYRSGIKKDMGVVTHLGVVGIIIDVSENFSSGISFLHKDAKISGRIKKNNQLVNVSWDGKNYRLGDISHIPSHISILPGDTIQTSGNSQIFPEGIMIGTIEYIEDEMVNVFKKGKIRFSIDYNQLMYVYIVENSSRHELLRLQKSLPDE